MIGVVTHQNRPLHVNKKGSKVSLFHIRTPPTIFRHFFSSQEAHQDELKVLYGKHLGRNFWMPELFSISLLALECLQL